MDGRARRGGAMSIMVRLATGFSTSMLTDEYLNNEKLKEQYADNCLPLWNKFLSDVSNIARNLSSDSPKVYALYCTINTYDAETPVEGGSARIPQIYGTSTVLFYRTRSSTVRTTGTVLVRYSCTGTGILLHWNSGSFWVEMSGAVVQTAQFAQATARELDQISPNPTVGR